MQENLGPHQWLLAHCEKPSNHLDFSSEFLRYGLAIWMEEDPVKIIRWFRQVRIGLPKNNIIRECTDLTFPLDNTLNAS
ncbi:hypothetical protein TNCV_1244201 [Trichonephila clavipes]|nr:hypothetical protein TNCV_1244201 [Trichonephila clavipes]